MLKSILLTINNLHFYTLALVCGYISESLCCELVIQFTEWLGLLLAINAGILIQRVYVITVSVHSESLQPNKINLKFKLVFEQR